MATVTRESIGPLHEKLTVNLEKTDYLPSFEKALKEYSRKANIPGFRKGMVPAGLIKKMYGHSLFTDEVLRSVDKELMQYLETGKVDIFAQPLPLSADFTQLDMNQPVDYKFEFEIGLKPDFQLPDMGKLPTTKYIVTVTDEMVNEEVSRLQNRYGNVADQETAGTDEHMVNVEFVETGADGQELEGGIRKDNSLLVKYFSPAVRAQVTGKKVGDFIVSDLKSAFDEKEREWIIGDLGLDKADPASADKTFKIAITKVGLLEKRELNEEFFKQLYPQKELKTEADLRDSIREEIKGYWNVQASNQIHDQVFHLLTDKTQIDFPEAFLKRWMKTQGEDGKQVQKSDEEVEHEFPKFISQLKWTLIADKIVREQAIQVEPDEIKAFAKQQLFSYMGGSGMSEDQPWVSDYAEKMMKDRKFVEDAYNRIQTRKLFEWTETQVKPEEKDISAEDFTKMVEEHQHHHH